MLIRKTRTAILVGATFITASMFGTHTYADYQYEAGIQVSDGSVDYDDASNDYEYTAISLGVSAYFEAIQEDTIPLDEQGFASKASYAGLAYGAVDYDKRIDSDRVSALLNYRVPKQPLRIYLGAGKSNYETTPNDSSINEWLLGGGYYVNDNGLMSLVFTKDSGDGLDGDDWTLSYKHLFSDEETPIALDVFIGSGTDISKTDLATVGGSFSVYITKQLGLGAGMFSQTRDYHNGHHGHYAQWSGHASYWLTQRFNLTLELAHAAETVEIPLGTDYDIESWHGAFSGTLRF